MELYIFSGSITARWWYAPHDMAKINNSKIERVTEMGKKKSKYGLIDSTMASKPRDPILKDNTFLRLCFPCTNARELATSSKQNWLLKAKLKMNLLT